ncbi:hypothetical protein CEUSTIGMA_g9876.t1 [Chlamydomonas eustigma]|uniref:Uncharacterized protein n=1 Tax=Chlamydomonas eustigma TaxID=1157962 RepID=A0A250XHQ4_9CHLO|nr:hypothetical protein CEUSTIGMA_g9876.t1 [Chlamydomonas eustigma]|eukprot:GAX82449.1 hypothetical protein CEUSTIGMA_g9876.t1 [Chlamydomonas eustigma]
MESNKYYHIMQSGFIGREDTISSGGVDSLNYMWKERVVEGRGAPADQYAAQPSNKQARHGHWMLQDHWAAARAETTPTPESPFGYTYENADKERAFQKEAERLAKEEEDEIQFRAEQYELMRHEQDENNKIY